MYVIQKAAEERKRQIYEADLLRKENPALTELELEARDRAQYLVERTNTLRLEREEEIQKLNKVRTCRGSTAELSVSSTTVRTSPSVDLPSSSSWTPSAKPLETRRSRRRSRSRWSCRRRRSGWTS